MGMKMMTDADGFAPSAEDQCDTHAECLGWVLCHHAGTERDADGWCDGEHPTDGPVWIWCPERVN